MGRLGLQLHAARLSAGHQLSEIPCKFARVPHSCTCCVGLASAGVYQYSSPPARASRAYPRSCISTRVVLSQHRSMSNIVSEPSSSLFPAPSHHNHSAASRHNRTQRSPICIFPEKRWDVPWSVRSVPLCTAIACFPEPAVFFPQCAGVARCPAAWNVLSTMLTLTWPCVQQTLPSEPQPKPTGACEQRVRSRSPSGRAWC